MANDTEMITTKTVVDLDEKTTPVDMDLFVIGNAGTATLKKLKWSSMLAAIKTKIAEWTFQTLNTSDKTIPGALNELNNKTVPDTTPIKSGDILSVTTERNGIWYFASAANGVTGIPEGTWGMVKYDKITDGLIFYTFIVGDTGRIMTNVYQNGNFLGWR